MSGRRVLVTGAASGLGAALVEGFLERGDRVLATDLASATWADDSPGLDTPLAGSRHSTSQGTGHERRTLDVTSADDWAAAQVWVTEEWGGLDVLVNNAGVPGGGRIDVADLDEWQWITDINLFGVVRGCRAFTPTFKAQRSGRIVNVASLAGLVHPAGMASYNAVKAAVVALSETLGHELAAYDVGVTVVCPSYFRTNLMDNLQGRDTALGAVMRHLVEESPTTAADIAAAVLAGIDAGDELVLPDGSARAAYALKTHDRPSYDALMRAQAAKLEERA